jgi:hypothetical protein
MHIRIRSVISDLYAYNTYHLDKWAAALKESKSFKNGKEEIVIEKLSNRD